MIEYSSDNWLDVIAWLINCDNKLIHFDDKFYTREMLFNSNSHGELFGVSQAVFFTKKCFENSFSETNKAICQRILDGEIIEPDVIYASSMGIRCITFMWQAPELVKLIKGLEAARATK